MVRGAAPGEEVVLPLRIRLQTLKDAFLEDNPDPPSLKSQHGQFQVKLQSQFLS
jgi:hypothetical protein